MRFLIHEIKIQFHGNKEISLGVSDQVYPKPTTSQLAGTSSQNSCGFSYKTDRVSTVLKQISLHYNPQMVGAYVYLPARWLVPLFILYSSRDPLYIFGDIKLSFDQRIFQ